MSVLHVMMCANDGYAMPLTVVAHSLLSQASRDVSIELHVVSDGISDANRMRIERCLAPAHPDARIL